jgi:hypothetical protein
MLGQRWAVVDKVLFSIHRVSETSATKGQPSKRWKEDLRRENGLVTYGRDGSRDMYRLCIARHHIRGDALIWRSLLEVAPARSEALDGHLS